MDLGFWADVDNGENTLQKKIRNGEISQYNFILGTEFPFSFLISSSTDHVYFASVVVGQEELDTRSVNVRNRDDVGEKKARSATIPLDVLYKSLQSLKESHNLSNKLEI